MQKQHMQKARGAVVAVTMFFVLGSSPFPGGCGSNLKQSKTYVDYVTMTCDTAVNGIQPPGCDSTVNEACDTIVNGHLAPECSGYTGAPSPNCTNPKYPLDCHNGFCCPSGYPSCCRDGHWCATDPTSCQAVDMPGGSDDSSGNGNGDGDGSYGGGRGMVCKDQSLGNCVTMQFCTATDGSSCFYAVNGKQFPCTSCSNINTCLNAATNAGIQACKH